MIVLLSCVLALCSCGAKSGDASDFNPTLNSWIFGDEAVAETEKGLYFYCGAYLFYLDYASMKADVLCFKPECLHYDEPDPFKIQDCDAHFNGHAGGAGGICLGAVDGRLYVLYNRLPETKPALISMDLDGSGRKIVHPDCSDIDSLLMRIHRGSLYYVKNTVGEDGNREYSIASMDLTAANPKEEIIYTISGKSAYVNNILPYQDAVYFDGGYEEEAEEGPHFHSQLYRYDLKKKKTTAVSDCAEISGAYDGKVLFRNQGTFYCCDAKSGKITEEENGLNVFSKANPGWQCHVDIVLPDCAILSCFDKEDANDFVTDWVVIDHTGRECTRIPEQGWSQKFHVVTEINSVRYLIAGNKSFDNDFVTAYKIDDLLQGYASPQYVLDPDENRNLDPGVNCYIEE